MKSIRSAMCCCAALTVLGLLIGRPLEPLEVYPIRPSDFSAPYQYHYLPQAERAGQSGDHDRAARIIGESLAFEPQVVGDLGPQRPARNAWEQQVGRIYASVHSVYAQYLDRAGQVQPAR